MSYVHIDVSDLSQLSASISQSACDVAVHKPILAYQHTYCKGYLKANVDLEYTAGNSSNIDYLCVQCLDGLV